MKLYKGAHLEGGSGTSAADPLPFLPDGTYSGNRPVARMYLEYCEKGEMAKKFERYPYRRQEEHVWRVLDCMAKALEVLEHGTEDPAVESWDTPIAHFDIKPPNTKLEIPPSVVMQFEKWRLSTFANLHCSTDRKA